MKQISAPTMQDALTIARRELGDDAVLLETKKVSKDKGVVVVFAVDEPDERLFDDDVMGEMDEIVPFRSEIARPATAKVELEHPAISLIAEALSYHGVPLALSQKLMASVYKTHLKPDSLIEVAQVALADALAEHFVFDPIATGAALPPRRALMLVGPHGAGKTSTITKIATELTMHRHPVVLISTDTERLNGTDGLQKVAEILASDFYVAETRAQLKVLLAKHLSNAWILIDSAGANIYEFAQMKALGELASLQDIEPILTCPAGMDADEAQEMANVFDFLAVERMIVTRLDAARRLKGIFATLVAGGYGLANQTSSANPTDACGPLSAIALSRLMLRHVRERLNH